MEPSDDSKGVPGGDPELQGELGVLIFVVDDEPMIGEVIQTLLEEFGIRTRIFSKPETALEALKSESETPQLLMTDFAMPGMNGMDLIQHARRLFPDLKTVLHSGNLREQDTCPYSEKPDAILVKPFLPSTLITTIRQVLNRPDGGACPPEL